MSILVIAEHNNKALGASTLHTVTAAKAIDVDVHVLVVGCDCQSVAADVSTVEGVNKVLLVEADSYTYQLAENVAPLIKDVSGCIHISWRLRQRLEKTSYLEWLHC